MKKILIAGCGDIALRVAALLRERYRLYGLTRNPARHDILRAAGILPVAGDLDDCARLTRIAGLADAVLHFAPPAPDERHRDLRTRNLLAALGCRPSALVYLSTSGVYGDCNGARVDETRPPHPQTARAWLRLDAERQIRAWARRNRVRAVILRVPGIYADDRLPLDRLRAGAPVIIAEEDSHTNHIHADDLARIAIAALHRGKPNRLYHACDDGEMKLGDYFDAVADARHLARPPRLPRTEVAHRVSPMAWSFMNESRRLTNARMKAELGIALRYATAEEMLRHTGNASGH